MHSLSLQSNFIWVNLQISNFIQNCCLHNDFTVAIFQTIVKLYDTRANDSFWLMQI